VALLSTYRKKRSFGVTAEPRGKQAKRGGDAFVIQKHAATRLHYDLRLELDGVMKSWAVTRGPSLVPGEKRLAVQVEDHPIEYNSFEGTIPKGEYGGGTVLIWDRGRWTPEFDPHYGLQKGHLEFTLDGEKLHGRWHLVRMQRRRGEKRDNWLLIKSEDEAARTARDPDILEEKPKSVVSKRTLEQIAQAEGAVWHSNRSVKDNVTASKAAKQPAKKVKAPARAKKTKAKSKSRAALATAQVLRAPPQRAGSKGLPDFVPPQLATLHDRPPDGAGWVHEVKFDGYRMQARLDGGRVTLLTRKALDWTAKFKPVANALAELDVQSALIDGEVVVADDQGVSNFSSLQDALKTGKSNFIYYAFDLLHLNGADLTGRPLVERKAALAKLLADQDRNGVLQFSDHFEISGSDMYRHACEHNLEGLISKRRDGAYRSGRSDAWIKSKCQRGQELVVVGYKDSTHLKNAIGALVLGYYQDGVLKYAGRSGTGYTVATAQDLWKRLQPLRIDKPAFGKLPEEERGRKGIWVEPKLVAEVNFAGFTAQGHVRHAAFKGLREDKSANDVVREKPMPAAKAKKQSAKSGKAKTTPSKTAPSKPSAKSRNSKPDDGGVVKLTHPDRVYWPEDEITKQQLADYYESVWDHIAPHVLNRPLALVRCPDGISGQCFFQKHTSAGLDGERIKRLKDSHGEELISIDGLDGLLTLVQAGVLEIHVWGSTVADIEHCNRIVFDLDPGDDVPWAAVNKAARELRERLAAIKLTSFVKTTGGKGLHVVVPVTGAGWDETKDFAHALTLAMAADSPDRYVAKMTKSIRGGKIFIDYLRNGRGATAVVAYSTRARAGAPLSVPVTWDELGPNLKPNKYTLLNIGKRLGGLKTDPWSDIGKVKQKLPKLA
jgi:bifunctional non-homologous end joining protein LigD